MTSDKRKDKEIDQHSGAETTGHEWDGIKELNNPAPRWWLWIFFITCIWSFGYWVVYPSWPTFSEDHERGGTKGILGWTQYEKLSLKQQEIAGRKEAYLEAFRKSSFERILNNPDLYNFAIAGGKAAFKNHCSTCHGTGGEGSPGYPNLNDDDWLWGGSISDIHTTIKVGIRSAHDDETRTSLMPSFNDMLSTKELGQVADYVLSLSNKSVYPQRGKALYAEHCASCHGDKGQGDINVGSPNLADSIWFYSTGDKASIIAQMQTPKHGMMPAWRDRLDEDTIRQLAVYVHSLGGGE